MLAWQSLQPAGSFLLGMPSSDDCQRLHVLCRSDWPLACKDDFLRRRGLRSENAHKIRGNRVKQISPQSDQTGNNYCLTCFGASAEGIQGRGEAWRPFSSHPLNGFYMTVICMRSSGRLLPSPKHVTETSRVQYTPRSLALHAQHKKGRNNQKGSANIQM